VFDYPELQVLVCLPALMAHALCKLVRYCLSFDQNADSITSDLVGRRLRYG